MALGTGGHAGAGARGLGEASLSEAAAMVGGGLVPARALGDSSWIRGWTGCGSRSRQKFYAQRKCAIGISERVIYTLRFVREFHN